MDNVAISQLQTAAVTTNSTGTAVQGGTGGFADFLALILGQMQGSADNLLGLGEDGTTNALALFGGNSKLSAEEQEKAMQQILASMLTNAQSSTSFQDTATQTTGLESLLNSSSGNATGISSSLQQLFGMQSVYEQLQNATDAEKVSDILSSASSFTDLSEFTGTGVQSGKATPQGNSNGEDLLLNAQFKLAVDDAQKLIKQQETTAQTTGVSVNELQKTVDSQIYLPDDAAAQKLDTQDLIDQLNQQISKSLSNQKADNDFVVKLKPEGLGEITVHMSQSDGHISLSILTSSDSVAKMLAGEIGTLANALKPMDATVNTIVSQAQQAQSYASAGGDFGGRQSGQFSNGSEYKSDTRTSVRSFEAEGVSAVPTAVRNASTSSLDTYI